LTNPSIIKLGCQVKQSLSDIAASFNDPELHASLRSNPALLDLGQHAKLKGAVSNPMTSLDALAGAILKKAFTPPSIPECWDSVTDTLTIEQLHSEVDCIWQIYILLSTRNSVGLPLVPSQTQLHDHPITLFQGEKPIAEGTLIWPHPSFLEAIDDDEGSKRRINITAKRSLIKLTQVLVPGAIHTLHAQCIQWIYDHGRKAVVTTSTLRSRGATPPMPSTSLDCMFASPVPPPPPLDEANIPSLALSIPGPDEEFNQVSHQENEFIDADEDFDDQDENQDDETQSNLECFGEEEVWLYYPLSY
jgi:hypothetical protein